jgi:hypothetical protein
MRKVNTKDIAEETSVRSPEHRVIRSDGRDYDYYDGEE